MGINPQILFPRANGLRWSTLVHRKRIHKRTICTHAHELAHLISEYELLNQPIPMLLKHHLGLCDLKLGHLMANFHFMRTLFIAVIKNHNREPRPQ